MILGGVMMYEIYVNSHNIWVAMVPGIPVLIVGFVLGSFGFYAALIKYATEEAVKEREAGHAINPWGNNQAQDYQAIFSEFGIEPISAVIAGPSDRMTARSMTLISSRTLPGHT
jgi:hypothetical protein